MTWHLTFPKKLMIYVGFPAEPEGIEARRTDFNRYFRQLDNPEYNRPEPFGCETLHPCLLQQQDVRHPMHGFCHPGPFVVKNV